MKAKFDWKHLPLTVYVAALTAWFVFPSFMPREPMHGNPHPRTMHALEWAVWPLLVASALARFVIHVDGEPAKRRASRCAGMLLLAAVIVVFWPVYRT